MELAKPERKKRKPLSEETRRKMSEAHRGKKMSAEAKQKISVSMKRKCLERSSETKDRISQGMLGNSNARKMRVASTTVQVPVEEKVNPLWEDVLLKINNGEPLTDDEKFLEQANRIRGVFKEPLFNDYKQARYYHRENGTFRVI